MSSNAERSLAMMAAEDGELQEAEEALTAMIDRIERELRAKPPDPGAVYELCRCLLDRASVRSWAVRPPEALLDLKRVEQLAEALKPFHRQRLRINLLESRTRLLGAPYSPVHDAAAAQVAAAQLRQEITAPGEMWIADTGEMRLAQHHKDWERVVALAPPVLDRLAELGQTRGVNAVRIQVSRAYLALGQADKAAAFAELAHAFFLHEGPPDISAQAAMALARARGRAQDWTLVEEALALVEQLTRAQRSVFDQQRYLVEKLQVYEDALRLALDLAASASTPAARENAIGRAWQVAERAKSFSLRQAMTQGGWLQAIDPVCAAELGVLEQRLEAVEMQVDNGEANAQLHAELAAQRQQVLQTAMRRTPLLAQTNAAPALDLTSLLRDLPDGVGVVSWYWLAHQDGWQLHIFHAGMDHALRHVAVEWSNDEVAALVQARKASTRGRNSLMPPMLPAKFGDRVFPAPVLAAIDGCHTLLLTPHRHLRQVPLHAAQVSLPAAGEGAEAWLIERFAVQVLPTLALPFPTRTTHDGLRHVLLMGSRQDGFGGAALDDVPLELNTLAASWRSAGHRVEECLISPEDRLAQHVPLAEWQDFDAIHLACHGRFVPNSPLDATLYLGGEALRASEFFALRLRTEVICLSACDLGQHSDSLEGLTLVSDEWLGLALPLFQAGTRSLLVSLWQAESAPARAFMQDFHRGILQGLTPARSHQRACQAQIQNRQRFGFWANWQLAGFPS